MIEIKTIRIASTQDFDKEFEYKLKRGFKLIPNSIILIPKTGISEERIQATFWKSDLKGYSEENVI